VLFLWTNITSILFLCMFINSIVNCYLTLFCYILFFIHIGCCVLGVLCFSYWYWSVFFKIWLAVSLPKGFFVKRLLRQKAGM